jgi:ribonuclease BN (tRNA processing enzyme)
MIDAGGGSFLRFGEAAATFTDLDFVGLSHFHTDHSADFPALLKSGYFANRDRPLTVSGPSGNSRFPGLQQYLTSMIGPDSGAYAYLSGYQDGSGGLPPLVSHEIDDEISTSLDLLPEYNEISIFAMRVPHGIVPAVAFRVEVDGKSIVFSSDQNGSDEGFAKFAGDASVLIMHMPIPENADAGARQLHAVPSKIAKVAKSARADTLLLSHFMARSLRTLEDNVQIIDDGFDGELLLAEDLYCQIVR